MILLLVNHLCPLNVAFSFTSIQTSCTVTFLLPNSTDREAVGNLRYAQEGILVIREFRTKRIERPDAQYGSYFHLLTLLVYNIPGAQIQKASGIVRASRASEVSRWMLSVRSTSYSLGVAIEGTS
jgi:hypothetical protein